MPKSLVHTKLRRDAQMRQKKYGRYLCLKSRLRAFEDASMEIEIELFDSEVIARQKRIRYIFGKHTFHPNFKAFNSSVN